LGARCCRWLLPGILVAGALLPLGLAQSPMDVDSSSADAAKKKSADNIARRVDVDFGEDGTLRMVLEFAALELESPYGKLTIPVEHLRRIDFATRLTPQVVQQIEESIKNLGSSDYASREAASQQLLALKEKAYPAVLRATKHADLEVAHRAGELAGKLRGSLSAEELQVREYDVVETIHSELSGRITASALPVSTSQFGALQLRLTDVRGLRSLAAAPAAAEMADVQPDPGLLPVSPWPVGKTVAFRVTGRIGGRIWGSGIYATESHLATAAVHAGALREGETGTVYVTVIPSPPSFPSTSRNGVVSEGFGQSAHPASYQIHPKPTGRSGRASR
jgi:hypothetical protein